MKNKFSFIDRGFIVFIACCLFSLVLFFIKDVKEVKYLRIHFSNFFSIIFQPKEIFNRLAFSESINDSLMFELKKISKINKDLSQRIRDINNYRNYDRKLDKLIHDHEFIPAKILNTSEFCKSACPKNDTDAPKITNIVENPKQNKINGKKFIFF